MLVLRFENPIIEPMGSIGFSGRTAIRNTEVDLRSDRLESDDRILERAHPNRVLPAQLVVVGRSDRVVPAHTVDDLHVEQVEVDGVRIHAVVRDLPDLRTVFAYR